MIHYFINKNFNDADELLFFYKENICENLMLQNPEAIRAVSNKLIDNIKKYAEKKCAVYKEFKNLYKRQDLINKENWMSKCFDPKRLMQQKTSGSTTGEHFQYYNDKKNFDYVQRNCEFDLILKEYNLYEKPISILNLFKHQYNPKPDKFFLKSNNHSKHPFHSYGTKESSTYFVNWEGYIENPEEWHKKILELLSKINVDIVLGPGPVFNILCKYIRKYDFKNHFAYLLSHTTEFPRINDFIFLKENGNISDYCDHMKCWDGGASFFTCKFNNYHLNDNFAWVHQGPNNELISTDYFNLASPFVNYWNGDLCEIKDEYHLCQCGRYYRPFKMLQNRPFALKGPTKLTEIRKKISELSFKNKINQVQFENLNVNIHCETILNQNEKEIIDDILKDYKTNYF